MISPTVQDLIHYTELESHDYKTRENTYREQIQVLRDELYSRYPAPNIKEIFSVLRRIQSIKSYKGLTGMLGGLFGAAISTASPVFYLSDEAASGLSGGEILAGASVLFSVGFAVGYIVGGRLYNRFSKEVKELINVYGNDILNRENVQAIGEEVERIKKLK